VVGTLPENVVLLNALPDAAALSQVEALWIAGLARAEAAAFATLAREQRVLLNVEDVPALCDFHSVAEVRRGDLLIGISTGGKSPGLAARVRRWIEGAFGPEWAERTAEIARQRDEWRARGASIPELACLTDETIATAGWMP
jgi:precorrin-2 dehydrogenase/sirohydrochlorin ferrochelatase